MNNEKREILEHLVEYLQDKIDTGYHKIFYNDDMYDEKTIDCINAINDTLEENKRLNKENEELKKIQCTFLGTGCKEEIERLNNIIKEAIEYIEKWQSFQHTNGTTHEELSNLKSILKGE